jgi:cellulose synthase/poly-beta-1,6-N-acetylglucosamine synthase-like glycosyltransferase
MSGVTISLLTVTALLLAAIPALLTLFNLKVFLPAPEPGGRMNKPEVSVLVPARDEAAAIEPCVRAILASRDVDLEVVVLDDASTDDSEAVARRYEAIDPRLRYHKHARNFDMEHVRKCSLITGC